MVDFASIIQTTAELVAIPGRSITGNIMLEVAKKINALGYWWQVGPKLRDENTLRTPSCILIPKTYRLTEQQLSGASKSYDFVLDIAFALKGDDDSIVNDIALAYSEIIMDLFTKDFDGNPGVFKFPAVTQHYNTTIEPAEIGVVQILRGGVLAYSSGINVVFSIWSS
jgi:hypothetical protein